MGRLTERKTYEVYRDAVGVVLAARRGDQDAVEWLLTFQPSLKAPAADVFIAMTCGLMREVDARGGDADELVRRWATNLAHREANA